MSAGAIKEGLSVGSCSWEDNSATARNVVLKEKKVGDEHLTFSAPASDNMTAPPPGQAQTAMRVTIPGRGADKTLEETGMECEVVRKQTEKNTHVSLLQFG